MKSSLIGKTVWCLIALASLVVRSSAQTLLPGAESANEPAILALTNESWQVFISSSNGSVCEIKNTLDATGMNWVHAQRPWGLLALGEGTNRMVFNRPASVRWIDAHTCESVYEADRLKLTVRRSIDPQDRFSEIYTLKNIGDSPRCFASDSTFLTVPFNDSYKAGAPTCLLKNGNVHLWAGGSSSWVNAVRMGGTPPHLGLVLTAGSLAG